ncbi:hypothetical protein XK86_11960 [Hafnia alvei]|nr:hypothetical protein XK86_11960 [Hafnia alvei]
MADERKTLTLKCPLAKNGYEGESLLQDIEVRKIALSNKATRRCLHAFSHTVRVFVADGCR